MRKTSTSCFLPAALLLLAAIAPAPAADWPTARGNPGRTGNTDGQAGPKAPKVRWVYKAPEHFVASPVPGENTFFVAGLGQLNSAHFHCLSLEPDAHNRDVYVKTSPLIQTPLVSSPALTDGVLVFGDGMHQTDGATLYCVKADNGRPLWQLPFPGKLVHLEGAPTVAAGKVYLGGGNAGVFCVDMNRVTVKGNEINLEAVKFLMDRTWTDLQAKYEKEKQKDGDLAVEPGDTDLPKATPKLLWQKGKDEWHVDAPVALAGDRVLAASAYVEEDKAGKRSLLALKASDGSIAWELPLKINPWGGTTVAGDLVLVACSSIRMDRSQIKQAAGEILAVAIADGKVRWRKDVPGGVLSPVAVQDGLAVFTATDGKVRAWDAKTGEPRWEYNGKTAFFAGPAIAGGKVYVADVGGVCHCLSLADGKADWTFDVPADPAVQLRGSVFGSPLVEGGDIFLGTNNLDEKGPPTPGVVVCLSDKPPALRVAGAQISIDPVHKSVTVPCRMALRKLPTLKEIYPLEVVACWPTPQGQKAHETVVVFDVKPSEIHKAMESLGCKAGRPWQTEGDRATGTPVELSLLVPGFDGKPRKIAIEKAMVEPKTGKPLPKLNWLFTGSVMRQPNPDKPDLVYGADMTGTLITIFPVTADTVFQTDLTMKEEPIFKLETNKNLLPEEETPVQLLIEVKGAQETGPRAAAAGPGTGSGTGTGAVK